MTQKSTILIVDDEPSARATLKALLFSEGYDLAFANDGAEALKKAAELVPDLILLDVMMPRGDGFQVCQHLRADPLLAQVPIIMVTALDGRDFRLQGLESGADDFISKPFDGVELQTRVRTITKLNRYRRLLLEQAKFEWVVEQAQDGYLMVNDSDDVLYANPQARLYLGLPVDESGPVSRTFTELIGKQYRCEPGESWAAWPEQPVAATASPRYLVRPGSATANAFWLQVDVMRMSPQAIFVCLRDVTSDIVTRDSMWAFHTFVGHKLRTPLGPLTGFLEILEQGLSTLPEAKIKHFLSSVRQSAERLQNEILGILQYVDTLNKSRPVRGRCSLAEISAITTEIKSSLEIESVSVTTHAIQDPDAAFVPLSHRAVEMVLWELGENAIKFHPEGAPTLEIELSSVPAGIQIQVRDDGRTLSPDQLAQVWTPYYQGDTDSSGEAPGMGLGLAVVASLVWGVGGTCRIYNREDGPGVVVELVLPWAESDEETDD